MKWRASFGGDRYPCVLQHGRTDSKVHLQGPTPLAPAIQQSKTKEEKETIAATFEDRGNSTPTVPSGNEGRSSTRRNRSKREEKEENNSAPIPVSPE